MKKKKENIKSKKRNSQPNALGCPSEISRKRNKSFRTHSAHLSLHWGENVENKDSLTLSSRSRSGTQNTLRFPSFKLHLMSSYADPPLHPPEIPPPLSALDSPLLECPLHYFFFCCSYYTALTFIFFPPIALFFLVAIRVSPPKPSTINRPSKSGHRTPPLSISSD